MTSGIVYLAIIGMWVAYFLPRWLHSHDEFSGKSVERYKSALRIVAAGSEKSISGAIHQDLDQGAKQAQKLLRRRIIFSLILLMTAFIGVGAAMNLMVWSYLAIPLSALIIYIVHVRRSARKNREQRRRIDELQRSSDGISNVNLIEVVTTKKVQPEYWVPLSEREQTGVTILPKGTAAQRNAWQPTEVPVPTYVNAPKAVTPRRVIDLTTPGAWTEEQERMEREALAAASPSTDEIFDQQLAEEAEHNKRNNRAANQ
jgi:hypothetical protein